MTIKSQDLYPSYEEPFYGPSDYSPILDSFGKILVQVDDEDYQGDSRVLYFKDGLYGYLNFGWGSCSGCDSLQACESHSEIQELIDGLEKDIMWLNKEEMLKFFKERDWEGQYSWHIEETKKFVEEVINYLEN